MIGEETLTEKNLVEIDKQIQELQDNIKKIEKKEKEFHEILIELRTNRDKKVTQWKYIASQIIKKREDK